MNKILVIIDPQYDFIEGGKLAVNGAQDAMYKLTQYITHNGYEYDAIVLTSDWHPFNHCSFKEYGGAWDRHCIQHSEGASIFEPLLQACYGIMEAKDVSVITKGSNPKKEEYSAFENVINFVHMQSLITANHTQQIDICGICGDFCVLQSIQSLQEMIKDRNITLNVLMPFTPSIGDGSTLLNYLKENNIDYAE